MRPLYLHHWGDQEKHNILFLHGFMGNGRDWAPLVQYLKHDFHLLAPDLPGHGESVYLYENNDYHFIDAAGLVMQVLDESEIETCSLVGYSMGGRLAMYLAVEYPHRFERMIVESASPGFEDKEDRFDRQEKDARTAGYIMDKDMNAFLESWYSQPLFGALRDHKDYSDMLAQRVVNDPEELARALRGMGQGEQPSLWQELAELTMPVLFIAGERDEKYSNLLRRAANSRPNFVLDIFKDVGHNVHFMRPEDYTRRIVEFINTGS